MDYKSLKKSHPAIYKILEKETKRQNETLNLIASENYASPAVLEALGSPFTNKYAEGRPRQRYYYGNSVVDELEEYAEDLVCKVFKISGKQWGVNVQPYSGSVANLAVYAGLLEPGDTVLAMSLEHGGHLTHGHKVSLTGKWWNFVHYGVGQDGRIDYERLERLAVQHSPKLIVCGATAYSRTIDFERLARIAKIIGPSAGPKSGAYLMADISHIAGLIAGQVHPSPFPFADVVTTTTHKTLRGPRSALIIARNELSERIDKAVFPGLQGGPHENQIAAVAVCLEEALKSGFKKYAGQVVKNAEFLAKELARLGFTIVSGGTDNHLFLVDLAPLGLTGKEAGESLQAAGIVVNKNMVPHDPRSPWDPSGIRLGTPAVTTRGMKEGDMRQVAALMKKLLIDKISPAHIKKEVLAMTAKFPIW